MTFVQKVQNYLDAGFPTLAVTSAEEGRVEAALVNAVSGRQMCVVAGARYFGWRQTASRPNSGSRRPPLQLAPAARPSRSG